MDVLTALKKLGKLIARAIGLAQDLGLDDDLVRDALSLVTDVPATIATTSDKREWAVAILMARGVKESIARIAVEIAVQLWKGRGRAVAP